MQIFRPTQIHCSIEDHPQRTSTTATVLAMLLRWGQWAKSGQKKTTKTLRVTEKLHPKKKCRRKRSGSFFEFDVFFAIDLQGFQPERAAKVGLFCKKARQSSNSQDTHDEAQEPPSNIEKKIMIFKHGGLVLP